MTRATSARSLTRGRAGRHRKAPDRHWIERVAESMVREIRSSRAMFAAFWLFTAQKNKE